jgi:hypothetical protein
VQRGIAFGARNIRQEGWNFGWYDEAFLIQTHNPLAIRISCTAQKCTVPAISQKHGFTTFGASNIRVFRNEWFSFSVDR